MLFLVALVGLTALSAPGAQSCLLQKETRSGDLSPAKKTLRQSESSHPAFIAISERLGAGVRGIKDMLMNQIKPTKDMPVILHEKEAGGGYKKGSPLYEKSQDRKAELGSFKSKSKPAVSESCQKVAQGFEKNIKSQWPMPGSGIFSVQIGNNPIYETAVGPISPAKKNTEKSTTPSSLFEIASVAKTMVSALILRKVVEGEISVSGSNPTKVTSVLDEETLPRAALLQNPDATIAQLLTMTSGLQHFWAAKPLKTISEWYADHEDLTAAKEKASQHKSFGALNKKKWSLFQFQAALRPFLEASGKLPQFSAIEILRMSSKADFGKIGEFEYSDTGYIILGLVVEKLYGKPLEAAIRGDLLAPLMNRKIEDIETVFRYDPKTGEDAVAAAGKSDRLSHRMF
jgi:hypothetical protein